MRRLRALMVALVLFTVLVLPAAAAGPNPFVGAWESSDGARLAVGLNNVGYRVLYFDRSSEYCEGDPALGIGTGTSDGNTLAASFDGFCLAPWRSMGTVANTFVYDPATGTLWDGMMSWHRTGRP